MAGTAWYAGENGKALGAVTCGAWLEIDAMNMEGGDIALANARAARRDMVARSWSLAAYAECMAVARELSRDYPGTMIRVDLYDNTHRTAVQHAVHNTVARYNRGERIG